MPRKKKHFSIEETKYYEQRFKRQPFKQPMNEQRYEWVDLTFYMMDHYQFRSLSPYSTKLYLYMRQWAYKNKEWGKTEVFAYSQTMAHSIGIMSVAQTKRCLAELWEKGFIDKVGYDEHHTALWKFSNRWYLDKSSKQYYYQLGNNWVDSKIYVVYKHILPNSKIYYGVTSQIPCNKRWLYGKGYIKNRQFYEDIKKYGWNNIKHEIIYRDLSAIEAVCYEYALILRDETYKNEKGYNHDNIQIDRFIHLNIANDNDYKKLDEILFKIIGKHIKELK